MKRHSILLVDDDRQILEAMADWLREQGYALDTAGGFAAAIQAIDRKAYDLVLADIRLGEGDGFDILAHCRKHRPQTTVILLTGYGSVDTAIEAIRAGAFDLLTKPLIDEELEMSIERALNQRQVIEENKHLKAQLDMRFGMENIVGRDLRMRKVFDVIDSVADTRATVLVAGESGTGKSLIARAIHRRSGRRDKPFVEVACGALPETLLESELFGHVAGAFTGANYDKVGKFMLADEGTIFLDEIGTASPSMQVKLLRVLQELEFEPVGGNKTQQVDCRVVLATNENLERLVQEGRFRQDLYYRINVIVLELPSLHDRPGDIALLAQHFLERIREESGKRVQGFTDEALATLQRHRWPGNVRELQNIVERAVLLGKGDVIRVEDLPSALVAVRPAAHEPVGSRTLKHALEGPERQIILEVLETHGWNRHATAEALGINRTTLYKKMKRLGLEDEVAEVRG
ncbi:MAG TPA: sigma-54 dependent transcriptional regulator [Pirellulales bacterium]|jgi:DNA-binding NtrC family response regulator|nr:sigma-54 dependent transcriptional regulator [Pirellulales bacterium]